MKREEKVLVSVFNLLKDEEVISKLTASGDVADGYELVKDKIEDVTEAEYKEAVETIKQNNGKVELNIADGELSDEELESVSGGAVSIGHINIHW